MSSTGPPHTYPASPDVPSQPMCTQPAHTYHYTRTKPAHTYHHTRTQPVHTCHYTRTQPAHTYPDTPSQLSRL